MLYNPSSISFASETDMPATKNDRTKVDTHTILNILNNLTNILNFLINNNRKILFMSYITTNI